MRDELARLRHWQADGTRFALAPVVSTSASAPRPPGATLAVHPDGEVVGSVSGGCVEGAVVEVAHQVLADGQPQRVTYGISDDEAFAVGLTCGGTIEVFVRPLTPDALDLDELGTHIGAEEPVAVATIVDHPDRPELAGTALLVEPTGARGST
ncbi:MAG: XdhC family protein, partial [Actinomycetota bacterium]